LPAIRIHSNHYAAGERFNGRQHLARRLIVVESVAAHAFGAGNQANQWLAERTAPAAHGPHVVGTRERRSVWVGVQETDDIAVLFFALQGPIAVEAHANALTRGTLHAPTEPDRASVLAEQYPALFDNRL
jgi:hypothetical protein